MSNIDVRIPGTNVYEFQVFKDHREHAKITKEIHSILDRMGRRIEDGLIKPQNTVEFKEEK